MSEIYETLVIEIWDDIIAGWAQQIIVKYVFTYNVFTLN